MFLQFAHPAYSFNSDMSFATQVERCSKMLAIVLCFSPIGDAWRARIRQFPSLVNCCTIDWYTVPRFGLTRRPVPRSSLGAWGLFVFFFYFLLFCFPLLPQCDLGVPVCLDTVHWPDAWASTSSMDVAWVVAGMTSGTVVIKIMHRPRPHNFGFCQGPVEKHPKIAGLAMEERGMGKYVSVLCGICRSRLTPLCARTWFHTAIVK